MKHTRFLFALMTLTACGAETAATETCAELAPMCAGRQQICVETAAGAACEACPLGSFANAAGECTSLGEPTYRHEFDAFTVQAGKEIKNLCQSWTLNNAEEVWVTAVEMNQDVASHHSIWTFSPTGLFGGEDGIWPCGDREYSYLTAIVRGGNLYNQSTQSPREVMRFAEGAAIRVPPYSTIIGDIHLLNSTPESITGSMKLAIYTVAEDQVRVKLGPAEVEFNDVFVPARSRSSMVTECELASDFADVGKSVDFDVYYVLPHMHERGRRQFIEVIGGPLDGQMLFDDRQYAAFEARGHSYPEPFRVRGATGLRVGCEYMNETPNDLEWGFNEEMCQIGLMVDSPLIFTGKASQLVEIGDHARRAQHCETVASVADHAKPGGAPPDAAAPAPTP